MTEIRLMMSNKRAVEILSSSRPIRPLDDIILDLAQIIEKGERAVNLSDARKLEELGVELIRHARETQSASY